MDAAHREVALLLRRLTVESNRTSAVFGDTHGLHRTDLDALAVVVGAAAAGREMTPGLLATELRLSSPATTALVDRLERAGHLVRERSSTDRRQVVLRVQDRARELAREFFVPMADRVADVLADMPDDDVRVVTAFLHRAVEALRHPTG
ncbi:DNA-binding transcriptional regulator, MarR family [Klenkia marina]|uniref:DNA-binding transcriptional regulator, MarR family n=1 Tax=Klenkia marina TaxID=1960309 RepID=A0A1G4XIZ8_9ACTN|nr:MarR family transcriptional regulator [Klenkia marina]SCX41182.1 DNA-binding transcriptional regulator, MarR family [Klenkia marina]